MAYLLTKRPSENTWVLIASGPHAEIQDRMNRLASDNPSRQYLTVSWQQLQRIKYRKAYE